jgi:hypothetical protein
VKIYEIRNSGGGEWSSIRKRARRALRSLALSQGRLRGYARLAQILRCAKNACSG